VQKCNKTNATLRLPQQQLGWALGAIFDDLDLNAQRRQHTRAVLGIRVLGEYLSDGLPGEGRS